MTYIPLVFALFTVPAFAKFEPLRHSTPRKSNAVLFRGSCAYALDTWSASGARVREMQRWLGAYLRDPSPTLPPDERLANALTDLHEEAVDRLADLSTTARADFTEYLEESGLGNGSVPGRLKIERFLWTLGAMDQLLRGARVADLGGAAGAGVMLSVLSGVLPLDDVVIADFDTDGTWAGETVIEPADYSAFITVEDTVNKLRRRGRIETLRAAFVPRYRYRREAMLETIGRLERIRDGLPRRVTEGVQLLRELRSEFLFDDGDPSEQGATFARIGMVLGELEGYVSLGESMNALGYSTLEEPFVPFNP